MNLLSTTSRHRAGAGAALVAIAAVAGACAPEAPPVTNPTTTTAAPATTSTTVPSNPEVSVSNVALDWTISQEANNGSFAGPANFWNATATPASNDATYVATDGDVAVLKKGAAGTYVQIGSATEVNYANRNRSGQTGVAATPFNTTFLDQKLSLTGGNGTVNTANGVASIEWDGAVTINFYGHYVPFTLEDFTLEVNASGNAQLKATASGIAKDMADPEAPGTVLPPTEVVVADLPNVYASGAFNTGFENAPTAYLGTAVTVTGEATPQSPQNANNAAYWGSWPQSFVDFQFATNLSSYWYTSGLSIDPLKVQAPVSVAFNIAG